MNHSMSNFSFDIHIFVMKKYIFLLSTIVLLSLCWCKTKSPQIDYDFENFHWYFLSENYYAEWYIQQLSWLWYQLLQDDIIKIYKQQDSSWFVNSIIISKRSSDQNLNEFVKDNFNLITNSSFKEESTKNNEINCNGSKIPIITKGSKIKTNLDTIYLSQSFFQKDEKIYIISFATLDIEERDNFTSHIKNINCK